MGTSERSARREDRLLPWINLIRFCIYYVARRVPVHATRELLAQLLILEPELHEPLAEHLVLLGQRVQRLGAADHVVAQLGNLEAERRAHAIKGAHSLLDLGVVLGGPHL